MYLPPEHNSGFSQSNHSTNSAPPAESSIHHVQSYTILIFENALLKKPLTLSSTLHFLLRCGDMTPIYLIILHFQRTVHKAMLLTGLEANSEQQLQYRIFRVHCGFGQYVCLYTTPCLYMKHLFFSLCSLKLSTLRSSNHRFYKKNVSTLILLLFQPSCPTSFLHFYLLLRQVGCAKGERIPLVWIFNKTPKYKWRSCLLLISSYFLYLRFLENQDTQFWKNFNKNCKLFTEITLHGRYVNLLYFPIHRLSEN